MIKTSQGQIPRPLIVDLARYFGGTEMRTLGLVTSAGVDAYHLACLKDSPLARRVKEAGITPIELREDKTNPRLALSLAQIVREGGYNILDAHNIQSRWWTMASQYFLKARPALVATIHSSTRQEHPGRLKGIMYERIERRLLPGFDGVITVSEFLRNELTHWKIPAERISLVPNGVHLKRVGKGERATVRSELGLEPHHLVIGSVGRLEPAKGLIYLLQAIDSLVPKWPQIRCVIVGEGRLCSDLSRYVVDQGLQDHVQFTGFRNDVMRLLEAFDVFVLPSITEGIPIALLEACVCGRPIVASRVGGVPEVLSDGRTGRLVEAGDVSGLAAAIAELLCDRDRGIRLGQQAEEEVVERYSMANMLRGTWQAYAKALQRQETRRR